MKKEILDSKDPNAIRTYIKKKYTLWAGGKFSKKKRQQKAIHYWCEAEFAPTFRGIVESEYPFHFKESFPKALAQAEMQKRNGVALQSKIGGHEKLAQHKRKVSKITIALEEIEKAENPKIAAPVTYSDDDLNKFWAKHDELINLQEGDKGFQKLRDIVETALDPEEVNDAFSTINLATEFDHGWKKTLTGSTSYADKTGKAEFDGMIGYQQKAGVTFEASDVDWGEVQLKLTESFKAGAWTSGNAKLKLQKLGLAAEVNAALAIGAQLQVKADASWKKGKAGLDLNGEATAFAGADAYLKGKLNIRSAEAIDIALKAGAFAGVKAKVKGKLKFSYDDETLFQSTAEASVSAGVGGSIDFGVKTSLFGGTQIKAGFDATVVVGGGFKSAMMVNFTGIYLAGRDQFRKVVYLKTISKGYKQDLLRSDVKNVHYADKCKKKLQAMKADLEEDIQDAEQHPMNVSLLMTL